MASGGAEFDSDIENDEGYNKVVDKLHKIVINEPLTLEEVYAIDKLKPDKYFKLTDKNPAQHAQFTHEAFDTVTKKNTEERDLKGDQMNAVLNPSKKSKKKKNKSKKKGKKTTQEDRRQSEVLDPTYVPPKRHQEPTEINWVLEMEQLEEQIRNPMNMEEFAREMSKDPNIAPLHEITLIDKFERLSTEQQQESPLNQLNDFGDTWQTPAQVIAELLHENETLENCSLFQGRKPFTATLLPPQKSFPTRESGSKSAPEIVIDLAPDQHVLAPPVAPVAAVSLEPVQELEIAANIPPLNLEQEDVQREPLRMLELNTNQEVVTEPAPDQQVPIAPVETVPTVLLEPVQELESAANVPPINMEQPVPTQPALEAQVVEESPINAILHISGDLLDIAEVQRIVRRRARNRVRRTETPPDENEDQPLRIIPNNKMRHRRNRRKLFEETNDMTFEFRHFMPISLTETQMILHAIHEPEIPPVNIDDNHPKSILRPSTFIVKSIDNLPPRRLSTISHELHNSEIGAVATMQQLCAQERLEYESAVLNSQRVENELEKLRRAIVPTPNTSANRQHSHRLPEVIYEPLTLAQQHEIDFANFVNSQNVNKQYLQVPNVAPPRRTSSQNQSKHSVQNASTVPEQNSKQRLPIDKEKKELLSIYFCLKQLQKEQKIDEIPLAALLNYTNKYSNMTKQRTVFGLTKLSWSRTKFIKLIKDDDNHTSHVKILK